MVAALVAFILAVNPSFHVADEAATHLAIIESKGGPPAALMAAMIAVESNWNPKLKGQNGEVGLCQIHPSHNPPDGWTAQVDWAASRLKTYYKRSGSWETALAAYNGGWPGRNRSRSKKYAKKVLAIAKKIKAKTD